VKLTNQEIWQNQSRLNSDRRAKKTGELLLKVRPFFYIIKCD
jgi:hypothetical protein